MLPTVRYQTERRRIPRQNELKNSLAPISTANNLGIYELNSLNHSST